MTSVSRCGAEVDGPGFAADAFSLRPSRVAEMIN